MAPREADGPHVRHGATRATRPPKDDGLAHRAEIEAMLDRMVPEVVARFSGRDAIPGWHVAYRLGLQLHRRDDHSAVPFMAPPNLAKLLRLAETNPHAFDAASYIAGMQLAEGWAIETPLRRFAAQVLAGEIQRPTEKGRPRAGDVPLRALQYGLCRDVAELCRIPLGRNRETRGAFNACQAVAEAFTRAGHRTTYSDLETLCYADKGQPPDIRALAEAMGFLDHAGTDWPEGEGA